jgi:hypothetical protein
MKFKVMITELTIKRWSFFWRVGERNQVKQVGEYFESPVYCKNVRVKYASLADEGQGVFFLFCLCCK